MTPKRTPATAGTTPTTKPDARTPVYALIDQRWPGARLLWTIHTRQVREPRTVSGTFPQPFEVSAYNINGAVVIFQQFEQHGWDAYVQASGSGLITDTLDAIDTATKRRGDYQNPDQQAEG